MANMFSETCLCYDIESETGVYTTCEECDPSEKEHTMSNPIDVWLKFENEIDEEAMAEANTYKDGDLFRVKWSLSAVGLITTETFATLKEAHAWYERNGFTDYTT